MRYPLSWIIILSIVIPHCTPARILGLFPVPGKSHFGFNEAIMKSLWKAGHQITMVSPFPQLKQMNNFTNINLSENAFIYIGQSNINDLRNYKFKRMLDTLMTMGIGYCDQILSDPEIKKFQDSKEKLFDVIFTELLGSHCIFPLARKLKAPLIGTSTKTTHTEVNLLSGNPENPAFMPCLYSSFSTNMNFYERLFNTYNYLLSAYYMRVYYRDATKQIYIKYFKNLLPEMIAIENDVSLVFTNGHHSILPRARMTNFIEIGGIHLSPEKPLPQKILNFIDEAEHGVILVSFGSVVRGDSMRTEVFEAFRQAFAEIPLRIMWKYENSSAVVSENVMLLDWLLQRDVLAHKNVKLFISHCGQSGTYEAIYTATPLIAIPLFGDQSYNAALLKDHKVAIRLDYETLTKEDVLHAINKIINDSSYAENMQKLSDRFKDQPMSPQESVVFWTEYVIRHNGAAHLRSAGAHLPWYQYLLLDVIAVVSFVLIVTVYILICISKRILKLTIKTCNKIKHCSSQTHNKKRS